MSKLSFRARALDASKPLPIYFADEIPDNADCSLINRAVPQMPTGMEKEEEAEHHLQRAICAGIVIPTPEVYDIEDLYNRLYPEDYKLPRQLIYMQPFSMEADIPDYDMDSEDENWVNSQSTKLELTADKFEEMMDRLEKGSGQTVVTLQEAKGLIKEDDDLIIAVYDYWLNKRLKTQHPLIPQVRTEARFGVSNHNPYIAFRRRTEKMQTRKNRKNDESSYEKMLKLKRDLTRAVTLLEMIKRREKSKREHLHLTIEVYEKRYQTGDFNGQLMNEILSSRPVRAGNLFPNNNVLNNTNKESVLQNKSKRNYNSSKKKKHKNLKYSDGSPTNYFDSLSQYQEDTSGDETTASPSAEEESDEGEFTFRRKKKCEYHAPIEQEGNWIWCSKDEGGPGDKKFRFCPTSINTQIIPLKNKYAGFCRRRVGRGGRIIMDRIRAPRTDEFWKSNCNDIINNSSKDTPTTSSSRLNPSSNTSTYELNIDKNSSFPLSDSNKFLNYNNSSIPSSLGIIKKEEGSSLPQMPTTSAYAYTERFYRPKSPLLIPKVEKEEVMEEEDEEVKEELDYTSARHKVPENNLSGKVRPPLGSFLGAVLKNGERPMVFNIENLNDQQIDDDLSECKPSDMVLLNGNGGQNLEESSYYTNSSNIIKSEDDNNMLDWLSEFGLNTDFIAPLSFEFFNFENTGREDVTEETKMEISDSTSLQSMHLSLPPPPPTTQSLLNSESPSNINIEEAMEGIEEDDGVIVLLEDNSSNSNSVTIQRRNSVDDKENETKTSSDKPSRTLIENGESSSEAVVTGMLDSSDDCIILSSTTDEKPTSNSIGKSSLVNGVNTNNNSTSSFLHLTESPTTGSGLSGVESGGGGETESNNSGDGLGNVGGVVGNVTTTTSSVSSDKLMKIHFFEPNTMQATLT